MTNLNDVWRNSRPIRDRLPGTNGGYQNEVCEWFTAYWDDEVVALLDYLDNFDVNPGTCEARFLDWLAAMFGFSGVYYNTTWPESTKRALLARAFDLIWPNKGSSMVLSYVITSFGIPVVITEGTAFILGTSEVGDSLGDIAWTYTIYLPTRYFRSPTEVLVRELDRLYSPAWCKGEVVFDDTYFRSVDAIAADTLAVVSPGPDEALIS